MAQRARLRHIDIQTGVARMSGLPKAEPAGHDAGRPVGQKGNIIQTWRKLLTRQLGLGRGKRLANRRDSDRDDSGHGHGTEAPSKRPRSRLGKSQLGRFANEDRMPDWLAHLLEEDGQVPSQGVIPVLQQLLERNQGTKYAYLCHPSVRHVAKLRREGGFCGYRNIQVLISHIVGSKVEGWERFGHDPPTIFQIQDMVESAWDRGYNPQGRIETGGIKGTRKYIGTSEAQAIFSSLGINCSVQAFRPEANGLTQDRLLGAVESYFQQGSGSDETAKVRCTTLAPIYLQHPGHSVTVVGLERRDDNEINLLVFDPTFRDSGSTVHLAGRLGRLKEAKLTGLLRPYRRGLAYLRKHDEFEVL